MKLSLGEGTALTAVPLLLLAVWVGTASAQPGSGTPPPPTGFEAQSASFVSAQTGFVLGARHCSILPCRALLEKTVNLGKNWAAVPAPAVQLQTHDASTPATAVSSVRFANANDGWLFGPGLWATTNGGKHWQRVTLPGVVYMLATSGGEAYAAVKPANGSDLQAHLYKSAVGSGKWSLVPKVAPVNTLTAFGHSAWTGAAPNLWRSTTGGKTWAKLSFKCPARYPDSSEVAAASANDVAIACSEMGSPQPGESYKQVLVSTNGGAKFVAVSGAPPLLGQIYGLAMPAGEPKMITINSASGASYLYQTINGGKTWTNGVPKLGVDGGLGFADLKFVSSTRGWAIHFMGTPFIAYSKGLLKGLYITKTKTWTWTRVSIP